MRRRLSVAFVLVAAVAAGTLAVGSYLSVRQARLADEERRARERVELTVSLARSLPARLKPADVVRFLDSFGATGPETVAVIDGHPVASVSFVPSDIPADLRGLVAGGDVAFERARVKGSSYLIMGSPVPGHRLQLYTFFSEADLLRDLRNLAVTLAVGWVVVVILAAAVGLLLARRTLEPVARASVAARSLAEGLLETRLPEDRSEADEFGVWAASFNEMAQALESKIGDLSEARDRERRFTSDVAHELRTPLTALVGEAALLREQLPTLPEAARRPAELLVADVARLRRLVDELMEISRLDAGRESVRLEPVDVRQLVEATVRARGWDGRVAISSDRLEIASDRRRLERIVANLVGNGIEHGGGRAAVSVRSDDGRAVVEVSDDGPGIAPRDIPHLFERFYKADPSRSTRGSGLGLAIARENARLLGGDITVRSEPGRGATFTVILPVSERLPGSEPSVAGDADHEGWSPDEGGRT
jgi:two-component system sensor histidine kinase MtrB